MPALGPDAMRPRALRRTARRQELRTFPHCVFRAGFGIHYSRANPTFKSSAEKALSVFGCRLGWPLRIRIGHSGNAGQIRNAAGCWRSTPCRFWNAMRRSSCLAAIASPPGIVTATPEEAEVAATLLGREPVFVKAQVGAGDRMSAGGIRAAHSA